MVAETQSPSAGAGSIRPDDLRCEYLVNPLGIDARQPRLSWQLNAEQADARGLSQPPYRIRVAPPEAGWKENQGALWDSGKGASSQSLHSAYAGKPLRSHAVCVWKVQVWDQAGTVSE